MHVLARSLRWLAVLCTTASCLASAWAQAPAAAAADWARRVALVIGNNAYADAPLANPINDARDMAGALRDSGFAVTLLTDVDQRQFQLALREFGERLKAAGSGGAGLFYFAGHGVQIKGRNYLIPVRSHIVHEDEVAYAALDAQAVLDKMESAGNGTNIVILDACRNNPFVRSARSSQQGLAQMDAPVGTLVAYATAPGSVAFDTSRTGSPNGLYTKHLLEAVRRPGLKVEDVFKQVRAAVLRASGNRQMPWEASALVGDFYFHPLREAGAAAPVPAAPAPDARADDAVWDAVKDSRSSAALYAYLSQFPSGRHAGEARRRLLDLAQPGGAPSPSATAALPAALAAEPPGPLMPPGFTTPPPRTRPAAGASEAARAAAAAAGALVEDAVRWGPHGSSTRPAEPRRNATGFAEGDRYRYLKTDFFGAGGSKDYLWQVDRIEPDGSLWVNDGRQRLDALGQRRGGNDEHTGVWLDVSPALPLLEAAQRGAGLVLPVTTTVRVRDGAGQIEQATLAGVLRTSADAARAPRGMPDLLPAVKVEVELAGIGRRDDGVSRSLLWKHTYWIALPLLLPVAFEIHESADGLTRQHTRHELIAIDQLSLADAAPGGGRR
ncbi:MAG: caspase family protein [Rubrivivax sp.]|nr:caspase family protein [Rubrivivax sp.]